MGIQCGCVRAHSSCFVNAIVAHMRLPFFQNIFKFFTFLLKFSNILPFFVLFLLFLWKIAHISLPSRIGSGCKSSLWTNFFCNFETTPVNKVCLTFSSQNETPLQLLPMLQWLILNCNQTLQAGFLAFYNNLVSHVRDLIRPWNFWKYVSLTFIEVYWWNHSHFWWHI